MVGIDHRLPVVGGALDLGVLELPREHVFDQVVGRLGVARLADSHPDGLVALEAHEQELVVAVAEERRESAEDLVDVHVPGGSIICLTTPSRSDHLALAVAEGLVLEEEEADREAVFEVVDLEELVDGARGCPRGWAAPE